MADAQSRRFERKTVMVTGAGTGFGAELAVRAAEEGAKVVVHYRSSADGARATAERVHAAGSEALVVQGGITSWDDIKRMAAFEVSEMLAPEYDPALLREALADAGGEMPARRAKRK